MFTSKYELLDENRKHIAWYGSIKNLIYGGELYMCKNFGGSINSTTSAKVSKALRETGEFIIAESYGHGKCFLTKYSKIPKITVMFWRGDVKGFSYANQEVIRSDSEKVFDKNIAKICREARRLGVNTMIMNHDRDVTIYIGKGKFGQS